MRSGVWCKEAGVHFREDLVHLVRNLYLIGALGKCMI